jgi:hypothetical protein
MAQSRQFSLFISIFKLSLQNKLCGALSLFFLLPLPALAELSPFTLFVSNAVIEVYRQDMPAFRLTKVGKGGIVIHGSGEQQPYSSIACEKEVSINIGSFYKVENRFYGDPKLGAISVSLCDAGKLSHAEAKKFQGNSINTFKLMSGNSPENEEELTRLLSSITIEKLNSGGVLYRFPVLLMGHGVMYYHTNIAIPADGDFVFVVQYGLNDRFCEEAPGTMICTEPEDSIKQIAQLLLEKWPNQ